MSLRHRIVAAFILCLAINRSSQQPDYYEAIITQSKLPGTRLKTHDNDAPTTSNSDANSDGKGSGHDVNGASGDGGIVKPSAHYVDSTTSYESSLENDDADSGSGSGEEFHDEELVRNNSDDRNDDHQIPTEGESVHQTSTEGESDNQITTEGESDNQITTEGESGLASGEHPSDESGDFNAEEQNGYTVRESPHDYMLNLQPSTTDFDPLVYPPVNKAGGNSKEGVQTGEGGMSAGFPVGDEQPEEEVSTDIFPPITIQKYKNSILKGTAVGSKMVNDTAERKSRDDDEERIPTLPILDRVMETRTMLHDKYSFKGCIITVLSSGCKVTFDLTSPLCKDVISLARLYRHMTRRDLDGYENFVQVEKFNVDEVNIDNCEKSITFVTTAKERFEMIRGSGIMVRGGTLDLEYKYEREVEPTFLSMAFDIAGQIKIANISTYFSLRKSKLANAGTYSFNLPNITASEFYATFTKQKELDPKTIAKMSKLVDVSLPTAKVSGSKNENGDSELILTTIGYRNVKGFGHCKIQVVVHKQIGRHASAGVIVGVKKIEASSALKYLTGVELPNIPLINDHKVDVIIEHANYVITPSRSDDINSVFLKKTMPVKLDHGTKLKAVVLLANQKGEHEMRTYVDIVIRTANISIQMPENTALQLIQVLGLLIPGFNEDLFTTVINETVKVRFLRFDVNVQTKDVLVVMDSYHGFTIGRNFTYVEEAKFILIRQEGKWQFSFAAAKEINKRVLSLFIQYEAKNYVLKGTIDELSVLDLIEHFNARGRVSNMIERNKKLEFAIRDVKMKGDFGNGMKIRVLGEASYLGFDAEFEGYIIDVGKPANAIAFGINVDHINIHDFAKKMLESVKEKGMSMLDIPWLSNTSASIVLADKSGIDKVVFSLASLKENEYLGEYNPTQDQGASFVLKVTIPDDCKKVTMCKLLRKQLGAGSVLHLSGEMNPTGFEVMALVKGKIEIAKNYVMEKSNLMLVVDQEAEEFSLNGEMVKQMNQNEVKFKASIKEQSDLDVMFILSMERDWESPFNISYVTFADFQMKSEINNGVMQDRFAVSGDIQIGSGSNPFRAALCGVVDVSTDKAFYYSKIESFSLEAVRLAFDVKHGNLNVLQDMQAPAGIVAGFAYPKPRRIQAIGMVLDREFAMKDTMVVLGYKVFCLLRVVDRSNVHITGKFDHLEIANELISVVSKDRSEGPLLQIQLTPTSAEFKIQGFVRVLRMGGETEVYITNDGVSFEMTGLMLGLFNTTASFSAPYKELSQIKPKEFKVKTCFEKDIVREIRKKAIKEIEESVKISKEADKESTTRYDTAELWFKKGLGKVEEWRMKMAQREMKLDQKRKELNEFKKKLQTDCVQECSKAKIPIGGIGIKNCHVGKEKIKCPYWIVKKHMQDDPLCLAKCEVKAIFRRKELTSLLSRSDFKEMQKTTQKFTKLGKMAESFFRAARTLIERAKETSMVVAEVGKAGDKAGKMIETHSLQNILKIEEVCLKATLDQADQGCFKFDFTAFIGNKGNLKKVLSEEVETCLNKNFTDELAKVVAYQAFPRLAPVKHKYEKIKELLNGFDAYAKEILERSKKLEAEETNTQSRTLKVDSSDCDSAECDSPYDESDVPEIVVRNDRTMQAFRDIFLANDNNNIEKEIEVPSAVMTATDKEVEGMYKEKVSEGTPSKRAECRQIQNIMGVYKDISDSIMFMQQKNKQLKDSYEAYLKNHQKSFDQLEESTLAQGRLLNLTDDEHNDAMFYVQKGKDGIAHWKEDFDKKYEYIDRLSLQFWREFIKDDLVAGKPIVKGLFDFTRLERSMLSKRYGIPHPFSESMKHAHRVANHLFDDAGSISSMSGRIFDLANHVHYMQQSKREMKC